MSVAPNPSSPVPRYTPQLPHPSVGGRSRRGWQGRRRGRRSCILRSRSGRGAFSSPASRRDGCVPPVHSARIRSLPILLQGRPVDGMGRTVALQAAFMEDIAVGFFHGSGGCGHIAVDHFILRTFRRDPVSGKLRVDRAMLEPGNAAAEDEIHVSLNKTVFIIMTSNRAGLEFSGTLKPPGCASFNGRGASKTVSWLPRKRQS